MHNAQSPSLSPALCLLLCCFRAGPQVREAVAAGRLTEADLDAALTNTLRMRFLTGQFDPPSANPWAGLPVSTVNSKEHRKLARQVVHKGMRGRAVVPVLHAYRLSLCPSFHAMIIT